LLQRYLQPLAPPDASHTLVVHEPSGLTEQRGDPTLTVPAVLVGQRNHVLDQEVFICPA